MRQELQDRYEEEYSGPGMPLLGLIVVVVAALCFLGGVLTEFVYRILYAAITGWLGV